MLGNELGKVYSTTILNPEFERRLKLFDPNLKLMFDQITKKWVILEYALDGSGWNILMKNLEAEDLNDKIINQLFVLANNAEERNRNPNQYFDDIMYAADKQREMIEKNLSDDHKHLVGGEQRNEWRKLARNLNNLPTADVTAGYPKPQKQEMSYGTSKIHLTDS